MSSSSKDYEEDEASDAGKDLPFVDSGKKVVGLRSPDKPDPLNTNLDEEGNTPKVVRDDSDMGANKIFGDSDEEEDDDDDISMSTDDDEDEDGYDEKDDDLDNALGFKRLTLVASDIKRGNLWKACYDLTVSPLFWILVTALIFAEPSICSYDPYEYQHVITASWIIILVSTVLLIIQLGAKTYVLDEKNIINKAKELHTRHKGGTIAEEEITATNKYITLGRLILSGSFVLELACLTIGWAFIFYRPGLAALRCFRLFRVLWYHELPPQILEPLKRTLACVLGRNLVDLILKVMKYATVTLSHLGQEMVFLTKKSRGGLMLMILLLYIAYVLGATLWVETRQSDLGNDFCTTIGSCTYTMIRLTFFDGNGFDFAYSLVDKHPILFAVSVMYLCVTSFGIVNGLIGVFGDIFKDDSDRIFETNKASEQKAQLLENEHFQRYNNTSESLVMLTLKMSQLEEQNEVLRESLKLIAGALKVDLGDMQPHSAHSYKVKSGKTPKTMKHAAALRSLRDGHREASEQAQAQGAGSGPPSSTKTGKSFFY